MATCTKKDLLFFQRPPSLRAPPFWTRRTKRNYNGSGSPIWLSVAVVSATATPPNASLIARGRWLATASTIRPVKNAKNANLFTLTDPGDEPRRIRPTNVCPASVITTHGGAGSTWNCFNCREACQGACVWNASTIRPADTATTAKKATLETPASPSLARRLASPATAIPWAPREKSVTKPVANVRARTASPGVNVIDALKAINRVDRLSRPVSKFPEPRFTTAPKITAGTGTMPPRRPTVVPIVAQRPSESPCASTARWTTCTSWPSRVATVPTIPSGLNSAWRSKIPTKDPRKKSKALAASDSVEVKWPLCGFLPDNWLVDVLR